MFWPAPTNPVSAGDARSWRRQAETLGLQGLTGAAEWAYAAAAGLDPDDVDLQCARARNFLRGEHFAAGFAMMECRRRHPLAGYREDGIPPWRGELLDGQSVLVRTEQGRGDTIQFLRFVDGIVSRGGHAALQCSPLLGPLLGSHRSLTCTVRPDAPRHVFAYRVDLMSLPLVLGARPEEFAAAVPYLFPRRDLVERWRQRLAALAGFRIGLVWQGSTQGSPERSAPLAEFAPLALPGVSLVSLQHGHGCEQVGGWRGASPLLDLGSGLDRGTGAFEETAAVVSQLDLVITVDTAMAHLAGALGAPVWLLAPFSADWRWGVGRDDSLWYPSMRVYRQRRPGDWSELCARVAADLRRLAALAERRG